ncbi:sodium- and chloride-dependent glycine transporter 2-like isoform X2 [Dermacentor andersoni]|uniref:sodium- and chloride-dependent glycine transporter 2-like isoform X2 n=1 Tax=Dermacentor andersoni TaxID=34620 RepID=UPI003B3A3C8C
MEVPRQKWANNVEFLLASTGMSIGLGNIWRFPYVAYDNGGGAFLLPYLLIMTVVGRSMFYMEMLMGQFRSAGATQVFDCVPLARGVGWAMVYTCFVICLYYNLLLSYALNFLWYSFSSEELPWTRCNPAWADDECFDSRNPLKACNYVNKTLYNMYLKQNGTDMATSVVLGGANGSVLVPEKLFTIYFSNCTETVVTAPEEFYENYVLGVSSGVHNLGRIQIGLVIGLAASWITVFFCVFKGVRSSGKVSYFTAITPFFILGVLMLRGVTLEGAGNGLYYYFYPQWEKLKLFKTWRAAAVQIFFSISLAQGLNMCLASYNDFNNNIVRDVYIIAATDSFISIFGGVVIFSVLGNMAHQLDVAVPDVVQSAFGLAFVVYPQALSLIEFPHFWSVTFFAMLFLLAIDSEFGFVEAALTPLKDEIPVCRAHETLVATICCVCFFIMGLPIASQILAVTSLTNFESVKVKRHGSLYEFPVWSQITGFLVAGIGLAIIPIIAIKELRAAKWDFWKAISPRDNWGPQGYEDRRRYRLFMVEKGYMKVEEAERLNEEEKELRELEIKLKALEEAKEAAAAQKPEVEAAGEAVKVKSKDEPKAEAKAGAKGEEKK